MAQKAAPPPPPAWVLGAPGAAGPATVHQQVPNPTPVFPRRLLAALIVSGGLAVLLSITISIVLLTGSGVVGLLASETRLLIFVILLALFLASLVVAQGRWKRFAGIHLPHYLSKAPGPSAQVKAAFKTVSAFQRGQTDRVLTHLDKLHAVPANAARPWQPNTPVSRPEATALLKRTTKRVKALAGAQVGTSLLIGLGFAATALVISTLLLEQDPVSIIFLAYPLGVLVGYWIPIHIIRLWCRTYVDMVFPAADAA